MTSAGLGGLLPVESNRCHGRRTAKAGDNGREPSEVGNQRDESAKSDDERGDEGGDKELTWKWRSPQGDCQGGQESCQSKGSEPTQSGREPSKKRPRNSRHAALTRQQSTKVGLFWSQHPRPLLVSLMFAIDQFPEEEKMYQSRAERSTQPCNSHQKGLSHIPARDATFTKNCKAK